LPVCQECGERLESENQKHDYYDCGNYHLKRAVEVFGLEKVKKFLSAFKKEA